MPLPTDAVVIPSGTDNSQDSAAAPVSSILPSDAVPIPQTPSSDGSSQGDLKSIAKGQFEGAQDLIKVANTPIKKLITGKSFEDDARAKSLAGSDVPQANSRPFDANVPEVQDAAFKNAVVSQGVDAATTPTILAGAGAKYIKAGGEALGEGANALKNGIARMALNPEFRSTASSSKYGQNAKRVMQSMPDVVGKDVHSTLDAVNNKLNETGQAIRSTIDNHPNANVKLDASQAVLKPFSDKISELNKQDPKANFSLIKRLKDAQQSMIKNTDEDGKLIGRNDLQNMTPRDLFDFRQQKIDPRTRYTGNPSDDKDLNSVFQEVKHNVKNLMNSNMPELKPLNQDYGDLHAAGDALKKLSDKSDNEGLPKINWKDIATGGFNRWIGNPINRINMARWLYTAPDAQIQQASQAIPGFNAGVKQSYGGPVNASLVSTPKSVGGPVARAAVGKSVPSGLPEGAYTTARNGANAEMPTGWLPNPNTTPINQAGHVPAGLPEPLGPTTRNGMNTPAGKGLPRPSQAGQSSGPVIKQGTTYTPPPGPRKYPQTDFGHQIKYQMQQKENVPLHPAESGRAELAKIYPPVVKGNPNLAPGDLDDFNDMKDWELSQNAGGWKSHGPQNDLSFTKSPTGHSEAFKKVSGNSEKNGFDLLRRASSGEEMSNGDKLKIKMMIHDFRKNIKPKMGLPE